MTNHTPTPQPDAKPSPNLNLSTVNSHLHHEGIANLKHDTTPTEAMELIGGTIKLLEGERLVGLQLTVEDGGWPTLDFRVRRPDSTHYQIRALLTGAGWVTAARDTDGSDYHEPMDYLLAKEKK